MFNTFVVTNSFQKWADSYARAFGFVVTLKGNWVELTKNGETIECMTAAGVQAACEEKRNDGHQPSS